MRNGLYRVAFNVPMENGAGVIHLRDGELWGGDGIAYYRGNYLTDDTGVALRLTVRRHSAGHIFFALEAVEIELRGQVVEDGAIVSGEIPNAPGAVVDARISFLSE